jgi:CheY-like chemotaxis protein
VAVDRSRDDAHAREGVADRNTASEARKGTGRLRVLLVEDNADLAAAMERLLRREGLEVRTALSGQEALVVTPDFEPQLILCDMSLPDMGGLEVIRKLRSRTAAFKTHVVMVTARSEREIRAYNRGAKEIGVEEFISKPVTAEVVRRLIAKLS